MSGTSTRRLVLLNCALIVGLMAGAVALTAIAWSKGSVDSRITSNVWPAPIVLLLALVGSLIAMRRPDNRIGAIICLLATGGALLTLSDAYVDHDVYIDDGSLVAVSLMAWVSNWLWVWIIMPPVTFLFLLCPDGRLPSARWRPVLLLDFVALTTLSITQATLDGPFEGYPTIENPLGIEAIGSLIETANYLGFILLMPAIGFSGAAMVHRFRKSRGRERLQLKWFAMAAAGAFLIFAASWPISIFIVDVWDVSSLLVVCLFPIAAGIAILRHQLYDIDRILNRTLVYAVLTASLGALYAGAVIGLQEVLRPLSGGSDLAIVLTTLVVAALFLPARRVVQTAVDRRFNRRAYDAARTIEAFSARLREQIDLDTLTREMRDIVIETMAPSRISIQLRVRNDSKTP